MSPFIPRPYEDAGDAAKNLAIARVFSSEKPAVVLFPCSHAVGVSVIRAFQGTGVPVLAVDFKPQAAGLYSRHATPLLLPGIYKDRETFRRTLLGLGALFKTPPVLFLVDDEDLFDSLRDPSFAKAFRLPQSSWDIVEPIVDKAQLFRTSQKNGFPIPSTWFVDSLEDLDRIKNELPYPCLIKPTYSTRFRQEFNIKAQRFDEFAPLHEFAGELLRKKLPFVVQKFIEGGQDALYTFAALSGPEGRVIAGFTGRKVHQFPPDFGTCRLGESIKDPRLAELGTELLRMTRYQGISLTEFKKGPEGGYHLIETNVRPGGWPERLAQLCGFNLVHLAYRQALGEELRPIAREQLYGLKWSNLAEDFYYSVRGYRLLGYRWAHRGLSQWMKDMNGVKTGAFFSWEDPLPSLVRFAGVVKDFWRRERSLRP